MTVTHCFCRKYRRHKIVVFRNYENPLFWFVICKENDICRNCRVDQFFLDFVCLASSQSIWQMNSDI